MSNPIDDAVQRAWSMNIGAPPLDNTVTPGYWMTIAAQEMAKTVRALHNPVAHVIRDLDLKVCSECLDRYGEPVLWPCNTARLIYPSEALR